MSRKRSRRPNLSSEALERARAEARGEVYTPSHEVHEVSGSAPAPQPRPVSPVGPTLAKRTLAPEQLAQEYSYVLVDLRNMAILAVALMILLVALALFA